MSRSPLSPYVAAITTSVRLGTAVLLPSLRQPVVLASELANLDQLSGGRLLLGGGPGLARSLGSGRVGRGRAGAWACERIASRSTSRSGESSGPDVQ